MRYSNEITYLVLNFQESLGVKTFLVQNVEERDRPPMKLSWKMDRFLK